MREAFINEMHIKGQACHTVDHGLPLDSIKGLMQQCLNTTDAFLGLLLIKNMILFYAVCLSSAMHFFIFAQFTSYFMQTESTCIYIALRW